MADEKPKDSGIGIDPKQLDDLIKLLRAQPALLQSDSATIEANTAAPIPAELRQLLDSIAVLEANQKVQMQKEAAETNKVDTTVANLWFKKHWTESRKCAICSNVNWGVSRTFAHLPEGVIGKGPVGTYQPVRTIPMVVLTCHTCGNTILLNAITMGFFSPGEK